MISNVLRQLARDTLSLTRRSIGLPHNRSRRYVRSIKNTFNEHTLNEQRAEAACTAFGLTRQAAEEIVNAFSQQQLAGDAREAIWKERNKSVMSLRDRATLFTVVHACRPLVCIETGASGGATSTLILECLHQHFGTASDQDGSAVPQLHSIDLDGPDSHKYGELIPAEYKAMWTLHLQKREPVLPNLLNELCHIDFFLHDSVHNWRHMLWEYELAWPHLKSGGVLASHDVLTSTAFDHFVMQHRDEVASSHTIANFGFVVKR